MLAEVLRNLRPVRGWPVSLRYLVTTLLVLGSFAVRLALVGVDDSQYLPLYLVFVPAVMLSALLFDRGSGYLAVILSAIVGSYFFMSTEDVGTFHIGSLIRLGMFLIVGFLVAAIVEALRNALDELVERNNELEVLRLQLATDKDRLEVSDRQRKLLLDDVNHRAKNHLHSAASMLDRKRRRLTDTQAAHALSDAIRQLKVLGRVYDRLHLSDRDVVLSGGDFVRDLCRELVETLGSDLPVDLVVRTEDVDFDSDRAVVIGLIVNELLTNAFKYAFPEGRQGTIVVSLERREEELVLVVGDDGIGCDSNNRTGTGMRLVRALATQLNGSASWTCTSGTRVEIRLPRSVASTGLVDLEHRFSGP